jgi:hypothetical protein
LAVGADPPREFHPLAAVHPEDRDLSRAQSSYENKWGNLEVLNMKKITQWKKLNIKKQSRFFLKIVG